MLAKSNHTLPFKVITCNDDKPNNICEYKYCIKEHRTRLKCLYYQSGCNYPFCTRGHPAQKQIPECLVLCIPKFVNQKQ